MKVSAKSQCLVSAFLFLVCLSVLSGESLASKERFKFLVTPRMFYSVPLGYYLKLDCTTNDRNATTELYYITSKFPHNWKLRSPTPGKIVKSGHVYTILNFGIYDAGRYQCRATNASGTEIKWSDNLANVIVYRFIMPPLDIDPKHAVVLTTGQSSNITCSSVSSSTLQWFKRLADGTEMAIPSSQTYSERDSVLDKLKVVLMFKNAQKSDTGNYVCKMTFKGRTKNKYSSLGVVDKDLMPHLKGRNKVLSVNETSGITMACTATGDPLPSIEWYKGSKFIDCISTDKACGPLLQYRLTRKIKTKNNTKLVRSWLRISRTNRVRDQGTYTCVAWNLYGAARRSYQLRVVH